MDQNLSDFINTSIAQGASREDIFKVLLDHGYSVSSIQEGFDSIVKVEKEEDSQKRVVKIVLVVAALLIGAGIFSFVASNWDQMGKFAKIFLILFFMLASYSSGWFIAEEKGYQKTGAALYLLGLVIYGAGIFLIAQMFNIRTNWADGFLLWMLGVIGFYMAINSAQYLFLAIILGVISIIGEPFVLFDSFSGDPFLLTSSFLLLASMITTFYVGNIIRKKILVEEQEYY